jgi:hypothetical protein
MKQNSYVRDTAEIENLSKNRVSVKTKMLKSIHKSKKIAFFICMLIAAIPICKSQEHKYIYLNAKQLEPLGIELSENGLYYQNCNPKYQEDGKLPYYAVHTFDTIQTVSSQISTDCDLADINYFMTRNASGDADSMFTGTNFFKDKKLTENDFYPLFVANTAEGTYNLSSENNDKELVPVAVRMEETNIPNRTDTIIFWFKVTESFKQALPKDIIIEDYMRLPDVEVK